MTQISASDIQFYLSNPGAVTGFSGVGTAGNSLGKYMSTTQVSATSLDCLFLDISGAQNAASQVDYQMLFILNNTATGNTMLNTTIFFPTATDVSGGATIQYALDNKGVVTKTQSATQAAVIANATTAPTSIGSWTNPSATVAGGLSVGSVPPASCFAVWFKRTASNSAALNNDGFGLQVVFDSNG